MSMFKAHVYVLTQDHMFHKIHLVFLFQVHQTYHKITMMLNKAI